MSSGWVYRELLSTPVLSTPSSSPPVMPISYIPHHMSARPPKHILRGGTDHLKPLLHGGSPLGVLLSDTDVLLLLLLRQVDHVRREKRLAVLSKVLLISIKHAVQPWEELLRAVVGVENHGDPVGGSNGTNVVSG